MPKNVTFWIIFIHFTVPNFDIFAHQRARKEEGAQLAKSGNTARGFLTFLRHARQHLTKLDSIAFCLRSSYHTVRKSQNLFKKWQNCEFEFWCQKSMICRDFYTLFSELRIFQKIEFSDIFFDFLTVCILSSLVSSICIS